MKIAYFDCFSGISGDMCLGALVDAGVPLKEIEKHLKKLHLKGYNLSEKKVRRAGFRATKVDVIQSLKVINEKPEAKRFNDIKNIIKSSKLSDNLKQKGGKIFRTLFEAESKAHGKPASQVHLHELGGIDCLIDIFGTLIGLELLGIKRVYASPVNLGGGSVQTAHGTLPVPAPATAEILLGVPVYSSDSLFESTTPTGAAILKSITEAFVEMPIFISEKIGIGAGSRNSKDIPNILRIFIGDIDNKSSHNTATVIETNVDDMNPQIYEYLSEKLFLEGALDVYMTNILMKKTRPGIKLSVVCTKDKRDALIQLILKETTTIGIRYYETHRILMDRKIKDVRTKYGKVKVKVSQLNKSNLKYTPEYEDCKKIAKRRNIPLLEVIEEVKREAKKKIK